MSGNGQQHSGIPKPILGLLAALANAGDGETEVHIHGLPGPSPETNGDGDGSVLSTSDLIGELVDRVADKAEELGFIKACGQHHHQELEQERDAANQAAKDMTEQLSTVQAERDGLQEQLDSTDERINKLQEDLETMTRSRNYYKKKSEGTAGGTG